MRAHSTPSRPRDAQAHPSSMIAAVLALPFFPDAPDAESALEPSLAGDVGLEGLANYVYLNPPPGDLSWEEHGRPFLGQWGCR